MAGGGGMSLESGGKSEDGRTLHGSGFAAGLTSFGLL